MARPSTKEAASQTDVISQAAQREGAKPGHKEHKKGREHHGCCSCKRFSILVALLAIAVGVYRKVGPRRALRAAAPPPSARRELPVRACSKPT